MTAVAYFACKYVYFLKAKLYLNGSLKNVVLMRGNVQFAC